MHTYLFLSFFLFVSILAVPVKQSKCQFEGARLYVGAIASQLIEDANRIPLADNATRHM
jgi:hypothetical protein